MPSLDPLVGRTIADRYEVVSLINGGGAGAVYRATQRALDRDVAIKFIRPELVAPQSERFMIEARAASRMNHPHVVSVFDFGRTSEPDGDLLFLVMELVTGLDLGAVMGRAGLLPLARVVDIVGQILEALGEAHHAGIVHRDVKPANVILALTRSSGDYVKLIAFGVAPVLSSERIAPIGRASGTPGYIAPEQALGESAGPAADLYSVGVLLFEMLTGRLPFERSTAAATVHAHLTAERHDPRELAPDRGIPDGLAAACLRALAIRPENRFKSAVEFEQAIRASGSTNDAPRSIGASSSKRVAVEAPLFGRTADLAWAREQWATPDRSPWIAFCGSPGVGRTRILRAVRELAQQDGAVVISVALDPHPYDELGYRGLLKIVARLADLPLVALMKCEVSGPVDLETLDALRVLLLRSDALPIDPALTRRAAATALGWAARRASARASGARTALFIDDIDRLDVASLNALRDQQRDEPVPGFTVVSTSERAPVAGSFNGIATRAIAGVTRADALRILSAVGREGLTLSRGDDDIEPMYVEQLRHAKTSEAHAIPTTLQSLIEWRLQGLGAAQRRLLQAIAIVGVARIEVLSRFFRASENAEGPPSEGASSEVEKVLASLTEGGFLSLRDGEITVTHELIARAARARAPGGALVEIHAAAADGTSPAPEWLELRAYHAIQGRGDSEAFRSVEEAARVRAQRGDDAGSIALLWRGMSVARIQIRRGEGATALAALGVFGRKLAKAFVGDGRFDEAEGLLEEILGASETADINRALVLEQLAALSELSGRGVEAARSRRDALAIAERHGDANGIERLRALLATGAPSHTPTPGSTLPAVASRRSVLVVEDDRAIREGLKSVVESDGREAFGAANGKEALDMLSRIPRPGLILLDLMMPIMTGWELLERLRADAAFSAIPVVVVSAVSQRDEPGATRVLQKPVDIKTLLSLVEEFCD